MIHDFLSNGKLLFRKLGIVPLLYGSLGLEYLTGESMHADDVDILIPEAFLHERWEEFRSVLECAGYVLTDEREHTFEKKGIAFSYASLEELEQFAGISVQELGRQEREGVPYYLLSLEQYEKVYMASAEDGYRREVRQKKDGEKLALIRKHLGKAQA